MKKKTKIILANAPINNGNRGCVALTITSLSILKQLFRSKGIEATIYLPDSAMRENGLQSYHVEGLEDLEYVSCNYPPISLKEILRGILYPTRLLNTIKIFQNCDFITDIGQGDSFADIYGSGRFSMIDKVHRLAKMFHKPYCLLPQTIGPFKNNDIRCKAVKSIENADAIMTRDEQSLDYVKEIAPKQKQVSQYIDVAFFMPYQKIDQDNHFIHVGLNVSALLWNGGYTRKNQFGLIDDYKSVVRTIIDYFLSLSNVKVHLVPHVVLQERDIENDYQVSYELWHEYHNSNVLLAPFALGPIEIKSYIAGLDFFMGARMHSTIGAFSSGVPVVPMAYSRKFNGLFEDTLDYHYMTDLKTQAANEILSTIKDAFEKRSELKVLIQHRMNTIVKEREQILYDDLRKFFRLA